MTVFGTDIMQYKCVLKNLEVIIRNKTKFMYDSFGAGVEKEIIAPDTGSTNKQSVAT